MNLKKIKFAFFKAAKGLFFSFPTMMGIFLLISIFKVMISSDFINHLFVGNIFLDSLIGSFFGSILAGNPTSSYIIAGELQTQGVSLIAIISFIVSWVTVGLIQLPGESILLSRKFAIFRNIFAFIFSIIVAIVTVYLVNLL